MSGRTKDMSKRSADRLQTRKGRIRSPMRKPCPTLAIQHAVPNDGITRGQTATRFQITALYAVAT